MVRRPSPAAAELRDVAEVTVTAPKSVSVTVVEPAPTKPIERSDKIDVIVSVHFALGNAFERATVTPNELDTKIKDILTNGYKVSKDGVTTLYPAHTITKIEVKQQLP